MRNFRGDILLSATDLMRFSGCQHATALDLRHLRGDGPEPSEPGEDIALLQARGDAHEADHLAGLRADGKTVVELGSGDLVQDAEATRHALEGGAEIIAQGALLGTRWGGWADFLERVEKPSKLGGFSYEVTDTKLKSRPHPKHVLQLVLYSDLLTEIQGIAPEFAHIELGTGERATLRLSDYGHYARGVRSRLEDFIENPPPTRPVPCADCALCCWAAHCSEVWRAEDSLFNVANMSRSQVSKLEAAGITTMEQLASQDRPVKGMAETTRQRLVTQARLQHARKTGEPDFEWRAPEPGKGFDLLPQPQAGDLFYDIEGNPHYEGGLEYLHGVWSEGRFQAFWAHDHDAEAQAVLDLFAFFRAHLQRYPDARIYHYAAYEISALRRLTTRYGIGEAFFDRLLRERRFVDLFAVVRGGLICSEPDYSIKSLEVFYGREREEEVKSGAGSVVAYENWRETREQAILDEIEKYNRVDCISTQELRDWLVSIRPEAPWPVLAEPREEQEGEEDAETEAFRARLSQSKLSAEQQEMLFNLGLFHRREAKPAQWAVFDSVGKDEEELVDDLEAIGGLHAIGKVEPIKRSYARRYGFPPQETKLRAGSTATVPNADGAPLAVTLEELDAASGEVTVKTGAGKEHLLTDILTLHPNWPLNTDVIAAALRDVIDDQCGPQRFSAVTDILNRSAPRLKGGARADLLGDADPVAGTIDVITAMDDTVLPIQGPPGTGKTYVSAQAILQLVEQGHRVAVASTSHEAIRNVLMGCVDAATGRQSSKQARLPLIAHKVSPSVGGYPKGFKGVHLATRNHDAALASADIVGGTAFFFSRPEVTQAFDWLFVDEAGQVSLANLLAMARAARNVVLVGDPRQLPQVIQGSHPYPANLSCLEWMLGDQATIPADRGIFLPVSRRMHPQICRFISEQVYEGRLSSYPDTARRRVSANALPEVGAFFMPVEHEGNVQSAVEEVSAIRRTIEELLRGRWTDMDGNTRPLKAEDIIVVAPYNAQVNALQAGLPATIRVGTVDKFQGQEAPICLVSMTASSAEEMPRGMEFLFSLNRINVAISRAKALALVFGSPRLREAKCETIERMQLVNTVCALPEWP